MKMEKGTMSTLTTRRTRDARTKHTKKLPDFLKLLGIVVAIPRMPKCVVANCFTSKPIFAHRDPDFDTFLPKKLATSRSVKVMGYKLTKVITEAEMERVGGKFTNLLQIEDLIFRTERGEKTNLATDGNTSIFLLKVGISVFTVRAYRSSVGWGVYCIRFRPEFGWYDEHRFFSLTT